MSAGIRRTADRLHKARRLGTKGSVPSFPAMADDPLLRRADQPIRECIITRQQACENVRQARLAVLDVTTTLRIIRAKPDYRFNLEMSHPNACAPESLEANSCAGCGQGTTSE